MKKTRSRRERHYPRIHGEIIRAQRAANPRYERPSAVTRLEAARDFLEGATLSKRARKHFEKQLDEVEKFIESERLRIRGVR